MHNRSRSLVSKDPLIIKQVPFPPLGIQLNLLFPDGRQTSVILKPGQSLEAKLREVEIQFIGG
jgi:hypothetical protein